MHLFALLVFHQYFHGLLVGFHIQISLIVVDENGERHKIVWLDIFVAVIMTTQHYIHIGIVENGQEFADLRENKSIIMQR